MFMCQTIVTEIQGQESAVYSYKGNLLSFAKIINESQAKEFAEFMTEEFQRIGQLEDFIKPISDELGVVSQSQFNMPVFNKNNPTQIEERECLMLKFGENKTIIFVGNIYADSCNNFIYSTIDFSKQQYHSHTFTYLQTTKNKQYLEALEALNMDKAKDIYKLIGTIGIAFL